MSENYLELEYQDVLKLDGGHLAVKIGAVEGDGYVLILVGLADATIIGVYDDNKDFPSEPVNPLHGMRDLIDLFGGKPEYVLLDGLKGRRWQSRLAIHYGTDLAGVPLEVIEAIKLAVCYNIPFYIREDVFERHKVGAGPASVPDNGGDRFESFVKEDFDLSTFKKFIK